MANAGPALVFEALEQGGVVMAQLIGVINEDNALDERLPNTKGKQVIIDLSKIERINSCGVRDWIRFAQRLEVAGNALYLLRCSPVVVAQLNMVRNFCGEKGQVVSFQAPYICPNCDEETTETFPANKVSSGTTPDATCPNCKSVMDFDDLPDLYFAFAKIHGPKAVPSEIQSAVDNFRTSGKASAMGAPSPAAAQRPAGATPMPPAPTHAAAPVAAVAPPPLAAATRPSNPALQARPAVAAAAPGAMGTVPPPPPRAASNPALQARPAAAAPGPGMTPPPRPASNPGLQSRPSVPAPPAAAAPPAGGAPQASGPKPVAARPMMGGSPFPAQRTSGLKPAMPPPNGAVDPTKKS